VRAYTNVHTQRQVVVRQDVLLALTRGAPGMVVRGRSRPGRSCGAVALFNVRGGHGALSTVAGSKERAGGERTSAADANVLRAFEDTTGQTGNTRGPAIVRCVSLICAAAGLPASAGPGKGPG
jgi:hypothetical protein